MHFFDIFTQIFEIEKPRYRSKLIVIPITMEHKHMVRILCSALLILASTTYAQIKIGGKVGYSIGRIADNSDNIYTEDYKSTDGVDFGAFVEFPINDLVSIQGEILYTQRGGERDGLQPIPTDNLESALAENGLSIEQLNQLVQLQGRGPVTNSDPLYAVFDNTSELEYIEIPVLLKLGWGNDWRFYVEGGPYIGFLIGADQITSGDSQFFLDSNGTMPLGVQNPFYDPNDPTFGPPFVPLPAQSFDATTDVKDDLNEINYGIHAGAGLIRRLNEKHEVFLGFRGSYGFKPLQKNEEFGESVVGGLVFSLGYAFTL